MSKEVEKELLVAHKLSSEADFAIPVVLSEKVVQTFLTHAWIDEKLYEHVLWRILWECRREMDAWFCQGEKFHFECRLPTAVHTCCGSYCRTSAEFQSYYRTDSSGNDVVIIALADE